jgi:hypothetical protein
MMLGQTLATLTALVKSIARSATAKAFAAALLISPIPLVATTLQAPAQVTFSVNFRYL